MQIHADSNGKVSCCGWSPYWWANRCTNFYEGSRKYRFTYSLDKHSA